MKVVLVTGSRDWSNWGVVYATLRAEKPDIVIHGACPTGADTMAAEYCDDMDNHAAAIPMPAQWTTLGRKAGPIRNVWMVGMLVLMRFAGHDCIVLGFPLGCSVGTRGCMKEAAREGFDIYNHGDE